MTQRFEMVRLVPQHQRPPAFDHDAPASRRHRRGSLTYPVQGAALAPTTTGVLSSGHLRRLMVALIAAALAVALIVTVAPEATEARAGLSEAERVIAYARSHVGARFRIGTEGMRHFDCSGLIYRVFQQAGVGKKVGGTRKLAKGYYRWFKVRGLLSRSNPKPGDLIW